VELFLQALFGAAIGEALFGKRLGNRALAWGALAGLLPYLDSVATLFLDTAATLWWHRGPSHSILAATLAALLLAKPLAKIWKKEKITPKQAGAFVFLTGCAHILLDCLHSTGVAVLWPLPIDRVSLGILSPHDPLLTLPLLVCIGWLVFLRKPKQRPKRVRLLAWGAGLSLLYAGCALAMKSIATTGFTSDLATRDIHAPRLTLIPAAHSSLAWRAVVDRADHLMVGHRSVFQKPSTPVRWVVFPRGIPADSPFSQEREIRRIQSFTDGFWIARPHKRGLWIADLRGGAVRVFKDKDPMLDHRMRVAWNFEPDAPKDRLIPAHIASPGLAYSVRETRAMILGRDDGARLTPRLAGVPGQFPKALQVEE